MMFLQMRCFSARTPVAHKLPLHITYFTAAFKYWARTICWRTMLLKGRDKLEADDAVFRKMYVDLGWPIFDLPPSI